MRKLYELFLLCACALALSPATPGIFAQDVRGGRESALFEKYCGVCHPGNGNIINPEKTLRKKDLAVNNVAAAKEIAKIMRKPGPGMTKFDRKTISERDAQKIAEYVVKTAW